MVPDRVEREILIDAPIDVVWAVITDPAHVSGWFGETAEIDLRPGGRITHAWKEEGGLTEEHGIVEEVEPPHYFSYRWIRGAEAEAREDNSTLVEFRLTVDGGDTRLRVVTVLQPPVGRQKGRRWSRTESSARSSSTPQSRSSGR